MRNVFRSVLFGSLSTMAALPLSRIWKPHSPISQTAFFVSRLSLLAYFGCSSRCMRNEDGASSSSSFFRILSDNENNDKYCSRVRESITNRLDGMCVCARESTALCSCNREHKYVQTQRAHSTFSMASASQCRRRALPRAWNGKSRFPAENNMLLRSRAHITRQRPVAEHSTQAIQLAVDHVRRMSCIF